MDKIDKLLSESPADAGIGGSHEAAQWDIIDVTEDPGQEIMDFARESGGGPIYLYDIVDTYIMASRVPMDAGTIEDKWEEFCNQE